MRIGRAIVKELHCQGAKIYALSKTQQNLDSLLEELPTNVIPICTEKALENVECVDVLINCAAFVEVENFLEITENPFDMQMNVNVKAALHLSQIVARKMIAEGKCGAIVNIGSISGKRAFQNVGVYCTTKAALDMLTKVMAIELGSHNITVNSVTPAMVDTDLIRNGLIPKGAKVANVLTDEFTKGFETFMASRSIASKPYIEMKDIVNAVLFWLQGKIVK
ncbi:L-xylulose reductase [Orchesella cincta]|uniref:L-xylulose reductase n=1 Tax=Orchesella cincta TaxID=48709 RepID=A0A1D2M5E2_ORCCI|nr:L-xylulose reductase [Orchesella cincta]